MDSNSGRGKRWFRLAVFVGIFSCMAWLAMFNLPPTSVYAQQPTGSIPTVTGTLSGPVVTVYSDRNIIEVYAGPSSYTYSQIGLLLAGETAPAIGRSFDTQWIQIVYLGVPGGKGWIYAPYVSITPGSLLPYVTDPPIATPRTTPTLDPTIAAAYGVNQVPARLPTFTPPSPIQYPTFQQATASRLSVPIGFIIIGLALVGILGAVISFLRGR